MHKRLAAPLLGGLALLAALRLDAKVVNVESFGAAANGNVDSTYAIRQAISAVREGDQLYFPCTQGFWYHVNSPIDFGGLQQSGIMGTSHGCGIQYNGGSSPYAFSFVGALNVDIRDVEFTNTSSSVPSTLVLLGRTSWNNMSGLLHFNNVQIDGYASKALVYSIAAEQNTWNAPFITLRGGGASYAFYTSSSDDLGVDNLPTASNLSVWMQNFTVLDGSASDPSHALIADAGWSSGAGNHTYRDGYLAASNSTAFRIVSKPGYINWMGLTIDSNRFENGYQMFDFAGGGSFGDVTLTNNKASGVSTYMISLPTTCYDCTFLANNVNQGDGTRSVFGTLQNSFVSENYQFSVGSVTNSYVFNRQVGSLAIGSYNSGSCSSSTEGQMQYLKGSGTFQICQARSGGYAWVTH